MRMLFDRLYVQLGLKGRQLPWATLVTILAKKIVACWASLSTIPRRPQCPGFWLRSREILGEGVVEPTLGLTMLCRSLGWKYNQSASTGMLEGGAGALA
jgi:hypothetical protein